MMLYRTLRIKMALFLWLAAVPWTTLCADDWAKCYRTVFSSSELRKNVYKKSITITREAIMPSTQLVVSWNAVRPERGYFSFAIAARDAKTKQWGGWHTMMEWGADRQRSFINTTKGLTSYYYARLEIDPKKLADGFRVRVFAHEGASLDKLLSLTVAAANFNRFKAENPLAAADGLPSIHLKGVPLLSQFLVDHKDKDRICSPTSCSMLANYITGQSLSVAAFADNAYDAGLQAYGSWAFNSAHLFELLAGSSWSMVARLNSFTQLHKYLSQGMPVVVSVRGSMKGAPKSYDNGHLLLVVGWDAATQTVICHDPAAKTVTEVLKYYSLRDFLGAWERSRRLAYIVKPR